MDIGLTTERTIYLDGHYGISYEKAGGLIGRNCLKVLCAMLITALLLGGLVMVMNIASVRIDTVPIPEQKVEIVPIVQEAEVQKKAEPVREAVSLPLPDYDIIMLDPGHGGEDEGCARGAVEEKDINLQIAGKLKTRLEDMGYVVLMTREEDITLTLEERVEIANASEADIYISIHQNAFEEDSAVGMETWYCGSTGGGVLADGSQAVVRENALWEDSMRLAQLLHQDMVLYGGGEDRGIRENKKLKVTRETRMPSCLVETGFLSNSEECARLTEGAYQDRIAEGLASGIDLYFHPKTMYLTFDDGPAPEYTERILDVLKEKEIQATFFVIGENVRRYPEIARRIAEEGHTIGIHSDTHDYDIIYESVDAYLADFFAAYETVKEVTGVETTLFRFPGGSVNAYNKKVSEDIITEMTARGYVYYDWNASLEDAARNNDIRTILDNARESTLGRRKIVMLAHDRVENTALCLEELIAQFPEYKMEALTAEVAPIQF